jgi:hypothetical protein
VQQWVSAVERQLNRADAPPAFVREWKAVAREYETIYSQTI